MIWKCCKKEPPETGKKVLCMFDGTFYVAMRIKDSYIPMPFAEHYMSEKLLHPELWCEIDFPNNYTGLIRVTVNNSVLLTLAQSEIEEPVFFEEFANMMISSVGKLKKDLI